jgi:hypothetical protein
MDADTGYSIFDSADSFDPELTTEGLTIQGMLQAVVQYSAVRLF